VQSIQHVSLEVCVDNLAALALCERQKADRIELCSALELGGLSPSFGLMKAASHIETPVYVMIRPCSGDFLYNAADIELMCCEIEQVVELGLAGVVLGVSNETGGLAMDQLSQLCAAAKGLGKTLHRVIDLLDDPFLAIDQAVALGFDRILTSGGQLNVALGALRIKEMQDYSKGRIEIMAGSGVNADNVAELLNTTHVNAVHSSCSSPLTANLALMPKALQMGFASAGKQQTDVHKITALKVALQ
jgi:copper homeostasis protein